MSEKPDTARSYRTTILDDNAIVSINLKWLGQIAVLIGMLVYGYWQIETRIKNLERNFEEANTTITELVQKHIVEEQQRYMVWVSAISVTLFIVVLMLPVVPLDRVDHLSSIASTWVISNMGIIGAFIAGNAFSRKSGGGKNEPI